MESSLDKSIALAVSNVRKTVKATQDEQYIEAFIRSAQKKASQVIDQLFQAESVFGNWKPVFVSVGGGDGEELVTLLERTNADHGVLLEFNRSSTSEARKKEHARLKRRKTIEVFEGTVQNYLNDAIDHAIRFVKSGKADFTAVTCHAVLHELYDRGEMEFDPSNFFGTIFKDENVHTWFSYREPGMPLKWENTVLLEADCKAASILTLSELLREFHPELRKLEPTPIIFGDGVKMSATLAMEVITKIFYLEDLPYEIQERSTSVDHIQMTNLLVLAIG